MIIAGDTNQRYTQSKDSIRTLLSGSGTKDVWLELYRGNTPPPYGNSIECPFPVAAGGESQSCELIDKILYRPSPLLNLKVTAFSNENSRFLRPDGGPLSDHFPVKAEFEWSLPANVRLSTEGIVGGTGGTWFNDIAGGMRRAKTVQLRGGNRLDQVQIMMQDGMALTHGGTGGTQTSVLDIEAGVNQMRVCSGVKDSSTRVFFLRIVNDTGEKAEAGKETGDCKDFRKPDNGKWALGGFVGRSGKEIDALVGGIWVKI